MVVLCEVPESATVACTAHVLPVLSHTSTVSLPSAELFVQEIVRRRPSGELNHPSSTAAVADA